MADVHIVLGHLQSGSRGAVAGLPGPIPLSVDVFTSSGSSQETDAAEIPDDGLHFWQVTVIGGDVLVCFGADPDAAVDDCWPVLAGQTREWAAVNGHKVAVIDA